MTSLVHCSDMTPRDRRNPRRAVLALAAWAATYILVSALVVSGAAGAALVVLSVVPALAAVHLYARYIREADELLRVIELQGLAAAAGAGFVAAPVVWLLGHAGVDISGVDLTLLVMSAAYAVGFLRIRRQYR